MPDEAKRTYHVEIKESAEAEVEQAYFWIMGRFPETADRWYAGLLDTIAQLSFLPRRNPIAPENDSFPEITLRQRLYGCGRNAWRILFFVQDNADTVWVLHVRHSARRLLTEPDNEI